MSFLSKISVSIFSLVCTTAFAQGEPVAFDRCVVNSYNEYSERLNTVFIEGNAEKCVAENKKCWDSAAEFVKKGERFYPYCVVSFYQDSSKVKVIDVQLSK